ncbi:MAG: nicotinamide riboside transporter PnuC [Gemmatimonadota bacterium]
MTAVELIAAIFGVASVYLSTRENIWSWPIGIVNVLLYCAVFLQARLYAGAGLQLVYFAIAVYGWYVWVRGGGRDSRGALTVSRAAPLTLIRLSLIAVAGWIALGSLLTTTDAAIPWLDSLLTSASLSAQWLLTRKKLETWIIWIAVDLVYVPLYLTQRLYPTAALYAAFLALAVLGLRQWRRSLAGTRLHAV